MIKNYLFILLLLFSSKSMAINNPLSGVLAGFVSSSFFLYLQREKIKKNNYIINSQKQVIESQEKDLRMNEKIKKFYEKNNSNK